MKRRAFITLLGGAAAWPLAARAQQPDQVRRIGVFMSVPENDPEAQVWLGTFSEGLQQLGWTAGHNIRLDYRWESGGQLVGLATPYPARKHRTRPQYSLRKPDPTTSQRARDWQ